MNLKDSFSLTCCLTFWILLLLSVIGLLPYNLVHFKKFNYISFHKDASFSRAFLTIFQLICFQDSLSLKSHFNVLRIFSIVLDWIATLVSFPLLGCSCFRLLYCYHGHVKFLFLSIARLVSRTPKAFLSIDYYLGILDTFRILFFSDCYVSTTRAFRIPFSRLLR